MTTVATTDSTIVTTMAVSCSIHSVPPIAVDSERVERDVVAAVKNLGAAEGAVVVLAFRSAGPTWTSIHASSSTR